MFDCVLIYKLCYIRFILVHESFNKAAYQEREQALAYLVSPQSLAFMVSTCIEYVFVELQSVLCVVEII